MEYQNPELKEELKAPVLNEEEVRQILAHLDEFKPLS